MNRATRRKLARTANCCLCFRPMTQQDRTIYTRPGLDADEPDRGVAHPRCVAADAQQRAARAEATVANMQRAATRVQDRIETAQRAQDLGIWLPS
jgi:hypothetical protein